MTDFYSCCRTLISLSILAIVDLQKVGGCEWTCVWGGGGGGSSGSVIHVDVCVCVCV